MFQLHSNKRHVMLLEIIKFRPLNWALELIMDPFNLGLNGPICKSRWISTDNGPQWLLGGNFMKQQIEVLD